MIRGQETAAKEKSFYQEEEITDKETVSPVDIAGSGQTNGDETAEKEQQIDTVGLKSPLVQRDKKTVNCTDKSQNNKRNGMVSQWNNREHTNNITGRAVRDQNQKNRYDQITQCIRVQADTEADSGQK